MDQIAVYYLHIIYSGKPYNTLLNNLLKQFTLRNLVIESYNSLQASTTLVDGKYPDILITDFTTLSDNLNLTRIPCFQIYLNNNCKIIILTDSFEIEIIKILSQRGFHAILPLDAGIQEIIAAIDEVCAGNKYIGDEIWDKMIAQLTGSAGTELSHIEQQIIGLMATRNASLEYIRERIGLARSEMQIYYRSIKSKLKMSHRPAIIEYAKQMEYDKLY